MRFAWIREKTGSHGPVKRVFTHPLNLLYMAYNIVWWIPIILYFPKVMDFNTAFITLFILTIVRLVVNLTRNNVLKWEQADNFPLRSV